MEAAARLFEQDNSLAERIRQLGVRPGDVVYTATDLSRVPLPKPDRQRFGDLRGQRRRDLWLEWVYLSVRDVIGEEGTQIVPTFSYEYARSNAPFVYEESPGEVCAFSEYVRRKPSAVRSLHPLFSLTAVGPAAHAICAGVGKSAYGAQSAFARLHEHHTVFLFLGAPLGEALTYAHHLEQLYGVNHYFHKVFDAPVYKVGQPVPGPWFAFVRYLGCGIQIHLQPFEDHLRSAGFLKTVQTSKGELQAVRCEVVHREGLARLAENPWYFIERPVYLRFSQDNLKIEDDSVPSHLIRFEDPP